MLATFLIYLIHVFYWRSINADGTEGETTGIPVSSCIELIKPYV